MRTTQERRRDAIERLQSAANVWVSSASASGKPHLVPLSLAWDGKHVLLATPSSTPTARNAAETGMVKATLDDANDVVLIDATVEVSDFESADPQLAAAYVARVGWDPADEDGDWSLLVLTPAKVQAWRGISEINGRIIMKQGQWLDAPG